MSGIETIVDFVPESDRDPSHRGGAQHQGDGGRRDFKVVGKLRKKTRQEKARLVGGLESQRDQDDVGKRKQGSRLAMVPLKHSFLVYGLRDDGFAQLATEEGEVLGHGGGGVHEDHDEAKDGGLDEAVFGDLKAGAFGGG